MDLARQQTIVARRNLESSELRVRESVVQTTAAVKQAYWTLKATLANVTLQQRSLELAQELVRQNKARVDVGQTPPLDLLQAEAEVAQRRENLIRANTAAGDAEDRLRRLIMDPADASFWRVRLDPTDEPAFGSVLPDVDAVAAGSVRRPLRSRTGAKGSAEHRDERGVLQRSEAARCAPRNVISRQRSRRHTVSSHGRVSRHGRRNGAQRLWQRARADVRQFLSDVERRPDRELFAGAQFRGGRARAGAGRAAAGHRSASRACSCRSPRRFVRRCARCRARPSASKPRGPATTVARQRLDVEQRRYEVGLSTSFLVTQAQRDLLQTEVNLLQATLDHQSALVSFEALQQAPALGDSQPTELAGLERHSSSGRRAPTGLFRPGSAPDSES